MNIQKGVESQKEVEAAAITIQARLSVSAKPCQKDKKPIFSVLKEGLSLSQRRGNYDIRYPTLVLHANGVHNMLGPSIDGGPDLRPKGRGRPQRILLGIWPDEHIKGVIKTVVFRDAKDLKEETFAHLSYGRHSESTLNYGDPSSQCSNACTCK
uniref:Uncharacterized protein n=1 Tax=Glossina austeni TaxID=7395 RepID=A0A1A9UMC2_GLOAU